jgi:putative transcriptional regulator
MGSKRTTLIALREAKGWRQEDVAKMLNISQQAVSLYENGKRDPSIRLAKKFEVLFKTPMEELFPDIFYNNETTKCNVDQQTA